MTHLTLTERKEIAHELWRIFCLVSPQVAFSFDTDGLTIRVPFKEDVDLAGAGLIFGSIRGYNEYEEEVLLDSNQKKVSTRG